MISDVIDVLSICRITLDGFGEVELLTNRDNTPTLFVGGSAIVFRVKCGEREYAMRCYLSSKPHLKEIYGDRYYPAAIEVNEFGAPRLIDIVMCDWIEGEVLSVVVRRALREGDRKLLGKLSRSFNRLAQKMLDRHDWAHGDLSTRNIVVDDELTMHLIDHDSNYVEALKGADVEEQGTPAFQSPLRNRAPLSADTDDFSIALISVALRALSVAPELNDLFPFEDGLLIDATQVYDSRYRVLQEVSNTLAHRGEFAAHRLARALSRQELHIESLAALIDFEVGLDEGLVVNSGDVELFEQMGVWGFARMTDGEVTTPPLYDEAFEYRGEEALVRVGRWWFYIDRTGSAKVSCGEWIKGKPPVVRSDIAR